MPGPPVASPLRDAGEQAPAGWAARGRAQGHPPALLVAPLGVAGVLQLAYTLGVSPRPGRKRLVVSPRGLLGVAVEMSPQGAIISDLGDRVW